MWTHESGAYSRCVLPQHHHGVHQPAALIEELAQAIYDADLSPPWQKPCDGYHSVACRLIAAGWSKVTGPQEN
jgi:hypothetical protein